MEEKGYGVLPFNIKRIGNAYLVSTKFGGWCFVDDNEQRQILKNKISKELEQKLRKNRIIVDENNIKEVIDKYRKLNINMFTGPSLHIVAVTSRCNHNCIYCHADSPNTANKDMDKETAIKVLDFIFKANTQIINIEFQGGEPLLNFDIVKFIVEQAEEINKIEKKKLSFSIATNMTLFNDKVMDFVKEHKIVVSTSLDGPETLHNINRPYLDGSGSYNDVVRWIKKLKKNDVFVGALPTITKYSLKQAEEIVNEYVKLGIEEIYLRPLNYLGAAKENWDKIGYSAEEFIRFWKTSFEYVLALNKKGIKIKERRARSFLKKILKSEDAMDTEMMSPCGAGRSQLLYDYDGAIYTCDEGRMLKEDLFMLGNVNKNSFEEVMGNENLVNVCNASIIDNYCQTCVFNPWCSTCPVLNYSTQGSIVPRIRETFKCKMNMAIFSFLFEILQDTEKRKIVENWL